MRRESITRSTFLRSCYMAQTLFYFFLGLGPYKPCLHQAQDQSKPATFGVRQHPHLSSRLLQCSGLFLQVVTGIRK